ncbi:recombinase family protein [Caproicibacter fermentans]|uniref:Recombinase family protein n=1 Tax=Caproicibacter fermentans TaxID=2576756 RepID=A0A7G8TF85_9FIRM|nr:recombinase family protein [Caproicibacter fermentans]QNK42276.1 recombinase family protein [Caproicibacter fermentans]
MENQKQRLIDYAKEQGHTIEGLVAEQESGLNSDREGLREVLTRISSGCIDAVLIESLDRLSRDMSQLMYFVDKLDRLDVKLIAIKGLPCDDWKGILRPYYSLFTPRTIATSD